MDTSSSNPELPSNTLLGLSEVLLRHSIASSSSSSTSLSLSSEAFVPPYTLHHQSSEKHLQSQDRPSMSVKQPQQQQQLQQRMACDSKLLTYGQVDQLNSAINLLVHFKYLFGVVRRRLEEGGWQCKVAPEVIIEVEWCEKAYHQLLHSSQFLKFIRHREHFYQSSMEMVTFKHVERLAEVHQLQPNAHHHNHQQNSGMMKSHLHFNATSSSSSSSTPGNLEALLTDADLSEPSSHLHNLTTNSNEAYHDRATSTSSSSSYPMEASRDAAYHLNSHASQESATQHSILPQLHSSLLSFTPTTNPTENTTTATNQAKQGTNNYMEQQHQFIQVNSSNSNNNNNNNSSSFTNTNHNQDESGKKKSRSRKLTTNNSTRPSNMSNSKLTVRSSSDQFETPSTSTLNTNNNNNNTNSRVSLESPQESSSSTDLGPSSDLLQVEYWCSYDSCRFKSKELAQVKAHEQRRHVLRLQKCSYEGCGEQFDSKEVLDSHMSHSHLGTKVKCLEKECSEMFPNDHKLKQHLKEAHRETYLTCSVCCKKFKSRKYLQRHAQKMHPDDATMADEGVEEDEADVPTGRGAGAANSNERTYSILTIELECTIDGCNLKFGKKSKLKQHIREEHREEYLTCKFCDKVCRTRNNLTNHIWIMHEEGEFRCTVDECDFVSKFRKNLLNHKKLRHQRVRKCTIETCGQMVPITRYQRHMSSLHKIKNYACSWPDCGKSFADHNALKNHVRIHLNFKRFKCKWPECGYASEQRFTVITHIRVCHFKLPRTKKKQLELNITTDDHQLNPYQYLEVCREDICI